MRKGTLTKVSADDLVAHVRLKWGEFKELVGTFRDVEGGDALELAQATIVKHVVRVEGYEDEDGKPITKLTTQEVDELDPVIVFQLFRAIMSVGDTIMRDISGVPVPFVPSRGDTPADSE